MNTFTLVFLFFLALASLTQWWLSSRQVRHVRDHRNAVPADFADKISLSTHQKAADYTLAKQRIGYLEMVISYTLLLVWTLGGGLELMDQAWRGLLQNEIASGIGFILSVMLLSAVLDLPFSLYRTFVLEQGFGFNRTTPALFFSDLFKQLLLSLFIGVPLLWVVLWLMGNSGALWWLYAWLVWTGFSLLMMWAYPSFIAPLFNKFAPLDNAELRQVIEQLLKRCGFESNGIFIMDGSRRSSHGNAYFTGMGGNKRIVFYDTLLTSLEPAEIEAVLAHELGHFKRKHIQKRMLSIFAISLGSLALLGWLMQQAWFYHGLGMSTASTHAALTLFLIISPVFTFLLQPISALISRKHEYEADNFAAEQSAPQHLINALVKLYQENASTLTPDPVYSAFYDSHPPAPLRVAHLKQKLQPQETKS